MTAPSDLANRALAASGADYRIGNILGGGKIEELIRDVYVPCRQQLLRAARWAFARKETPLFLLAKRRDNFSLDNLGENGQPISDQVIWPWRYEYMYPIDCMEVRFVIRRHDRHDGDNLQPTPPSFVNIPIPNGWATGGVVNVGSQREIRHRQIQRARFLKAIDPNFPGLVGAITDWSQMPDLEGQVGVGLTARTVILTDQRHAMAVYTADVEFPDEWDSMFQQAFVDLLTSYIALPVAVALDKDKAFGTKMMELAIARAKVVITQARVADANEGTQSTDTVPDWIHDRWRYTGGRNGGGYGLGGYGDGEDGYGGGFGEISGPVVFGNGSAF
jgi:hypothetical protein